VSARRFVFHHVWRLPVDRRQVYAALAAPDDYPSWWPQVRSVRRVDERSGWALVRSLAPYSLRLLLTESVQDESAGVLEVEVAGDLVGWCRWTVQPAPRGSGAVAVFDQQVDVVGRRLGVAAVVGRPLLVGNHAWMMRGGERGLTAWLTGSPASIVTDS